MRVNSLRCQPGTHGSPFGRTRMRNTLKNTIFQDFKLETSRQTDVGLIALMLALGLALVVPNEGRSETYLSPGLGYVMQVGPCEDTPATSCARMIRQSRALGGEGRLQGKRVGSPIVTGEGRVVGRMAEDAGSVLIYTCSNKDCSQIRLRRLGRLHPSLRHAPFMP